MPRTMLRRRLEPEARRLEILEAAERLLRARGPAIRVEDVVREAGAAKGTFYLYFPAWDDLLEVLRARVFEAFNREHPLPRGPAIDWLQVVQGQACAFVDSVVALGRLHEVIFHSGFEQRRPLPEGKDAIGRFAMLVRVGVRAGTFADVAPALTGRLLFAAVHEAADAVASGADRDRVLAALRWILLRTLEPASRRPGARLRANQRP
jgi:AcrR family transcriptional regulator